MSEGKLKFDDLKYIVMEGGGARGAAYLGAIRAMEELMADRKTRDSSIFVYPTTGRTKPGLLDYYQVVGGKEVPVVKGIAGSSAGAITTFALGLGFNSDEIAQILTYDFDSFLKETNVGKYRMITDAGELAVGNDAKNERTKQKELAFDEAFKFDFGSDFSDVGDDNKKMVKRTLTFDLIFKVIVDGIDTNLKQIISLLGRIFGVKEPADAPPFLRGLFKWVSRSDNSFLKNIAISKLLSLGIFRVFIPYVLKIPEKVTPQNIASVFSDRGLYSGFRVREFFMDMVLFAATRETQFHRGIVKMISDKSLTDLIKLFHTDIKRDVRIGNTKSIKAELLKYPGFEMGKRSQSKIRNNVNLDLTLSCMSQITFRHFYEITKINYGACVSNFTTGMPVYFGVEWTPDFRVMEAVASSMSIPPAIRPVYNESNVFHLSKANYIPSADTKAFDINQYYFDQHLVKLALQQEINTSSKDFIHTNNSIDISTFLPALRKIVVGDSYTLETQNLEVLNSLNNIQTEITIQDKNYVVSYEMYAYFYNAMYKGLFLDGGYRNNIPYNFFREANGQLTGVFAIKLDENFPPTLLRDVYAEIRKYLTTEEEIALQMREEIIALQRKNPQVDSAAVKAIVFAASDQSAEAMQIVIEKAKEIFAGYLQSLQNALEKDADKSKVKELKRQLNRDEEWIRKLVISTIKNFSKKRMSPPWTNRVSILTTAFEGYAYGSERGQIRQVSDHSHILPLYDYGVGTYDFDMKKVGAAVDLAQVKAKEETLNFFK